ERVKSEKIRKPSEVKDEVKNIIAEKLEGGEDMGLNTIPSIVLVIGVKGVGKTTTIGKMAAMYKAEGKKVILGAADTFRAAAIDQLDIWAKRAEVDIVKAKEGADPAAVVFDTVNAAIARDCDIVIIDTAGRLHNKKNLMEELTKIYRVIDRELPYADREVLLVLDSQTGQNAVSQAKSFMEATNNEITGIVLTKLDGTARGGIVLAIKNELKIPVKFVGVGEQMDDLQPFDPHAFADSLFEEIPDDYEQKESTYHEQIAANRNSDENIQHSGKVMEAQKLNQIAARNEEERRRKAESESEKEREKPAAPIYNAELYAGTESGIEDISLEEANEILQEIGESLFAEEIEPAGGTSERAQNEDREGGETLEDRDAGSEESLETQDILDSETASIKEEIGKAEEQDGQPREEPVEENNADILSAFGLRSRLFDSAPAESAVDSLPADNDGSPAVSPERQLSPKELKRLRKEEKKRAKEERKRR
ncbi:MAG: signal recognition particle-docking protein FtsY, partial [Clostridia bacterium]|nr:signal recognition particle-docking protein FtsY [Clostridia bacterium]